MQLRVTAANCENLFGRYAFLDKPASAKKAGYENLIRELDVVTLEPGRSGKLKPAKISEQQRRTTANAILGAKPDGPALKLICIDASVPLSRGSLTVEAR